MSLRVLSSRVISRVVIGSSKTIAANNLVGQQRMLSITYSGGQATEGQGGYYGSGGARKLDCTSDEKGTTQWQRPQMLALAGDVTKITALMNEVDTLESLLEDEIASNSDSVTPTGKTIEIKSKMKKLCTQPDFVECLNRLEVDGEPVWGLSSDERDMIIRARSRVTLGM